MTSNTSNRLTASLAIGLLIVLATVLGLLTHAPQTDFQERPSTFFTDDTGARALHLTLQKLLPAVEQWRRPLTLLPSPEATNAFTTLIVAGPTLSLAEGEVQRLLSWVNAGGQLVLLCEDGWRIRRPSGSRGASEAPTTNAPGSSEEPRPAEERDTLLKRMGLRVTGPHRGRREREKKVEMDRVVVQVRGVERGLAFAVATGFKWEGEGRPLVQAGGETVALEVPWGQGRLIALGDPGFVSNRAQRQSDNAVWLARLCAGWGQGSVWWDEYHHGFGQARGAADLSLSFLRTPWGWCVLQLLAAGACYALLYRRRMGRVQEPAPPRRRGAVSLIEARAGLFRAARARRLAADLMVQNLCTELGAPGGNPGEWLAFCRQQQARHTGGPLAARFQELARLYEELRQSRSPAEALLRQLGEVCGQIYQELTHER